MKQNLKRILLGLITAVSILSLSGCGKAASGFPTGLGVMVAAVLVFVISLRFRKKSETGTDDKEKVPAPASFAPPVQREEELMDDLELAAVIAAAVADSAGSRPGDLIVRSIKRAPAGSWRKA